MKQTYKNGFIILPMIFLITSLGLALAYTTIMIERQSHEMKDYIQFSHIQTQHLKQLQKNNLTETMRQNSTLIPSLSEPINSTRLLIIFPSFFRKDTVEMSIYLAKTPLFVYSVAVSKDSITRTAFRRRYHIDQSGNFVWEELEPW